MSIMYHMKKIVISIITVIVIFFVASSISNSFLDKAAGKRLSNEDNPKSFEVKQGQNVKQVGVNLEKQGIISSSSVFIRYAKNIKADKKIRAGTYELNTKMSTKEVLATLVSGARKEAWITIPEGWRIN